MKRVIIAAFVVLMVVAAIIVAVNFPWKTDEPLSTKEIEKNRQYYATAYASPDKAPSEYETKYTRIAREAAEQSGIHGQVSRFVDQYGLKGGAMLDIGSGRGYLQDIVENYTGLDISPSVARFYRRGFVQGTATAMPFKDNSFDGGWSVWVLEHVPNPEQALIEIRRVMKPGAIVFLLPAWNCTPWAAEGYEVRPASDFSVGGQLIRASIPLQKSRLYRAVAMVPTRVGRAVVAKLGPTRFRYRAIAANEKEYWEPDSDAINSIDRHEMMLWFQSRGDECLNCDGSGPLMTGGRPLFIRIRK